MNVSDVRESRGPTLRNSFALLFLLTAAPVFGASSRSVVLRCGASLRVQPGWRVVPVARAAGESAVCAVDIVERSRGGKERSLVRIEFFTAASSEICDATSICQDADGAWQIEGRGGAHNEAAVKELPYARMIHGWAETGWYTEEGYQGSAQVPVVLLDDRSGRLALITGFLGVDEHRFEEVASSFRFRE